MLIGLSKFHKTPQNKTPSVLPTKFSDKVKIGNYFHNYINFHNTSNHDFDRIITHNYTAYNSNGGYNNQLKATQVEARYDNKEAANKTRLASSVEEDETVSNDRTDQQQGNAPAKP